MKLLISLDELKVKKCRDLISLECLQCGKKHYRTKNIILRILNGNLKGTGKGNYCSSKCFRLNKTEKTTTTVHCQQCEKIFKRKMSAYNNKNNFCSSSCAATYNNTHKTKGYRRSKLEKWIEQQLLILYPNLEIQYNKTNAINSELDIYIPSLQLAFELNGIFHYEPIFGENKLDKIKNNDQRKFQACLEKNIKLCIIDVHNVKYLKKERDKKFLDIIINIINKNLEPKVGSAPT